ncbi:MAG: DUF6232 family protein [Zymomonas mobilis subsp. pomaceae]|uniref:Uncharacterized protein n=1 Tax=Zymomonas mobilis subsp. pomaceae (strain ATCC 29192 / DSM 22645 / JCM 10191 / CCUG 17912 / NBRC 13757 / NCIMB 11200 / NRRL B-4491 / Barker I) TaxID=579138 RepID=F8EVI9_ZYMMT|nr:DUF6232 family protein [Zymomonas mobilis]AEI38326.1 hypothetical protein Zymop_1436 [Zymomonas mobilis subsp. pomaceae ATCC 29192]MDX5948015.1 DUF6232 family protein [Zymomonas mobilis subsp. pomaceae]
MTEIVFQDKNITITDHLVKTKAHTYSINEIEQVSVRLQPRSKYIKCAVIAGILSIILFVFTSLLIKILGVIAFLVMTAYIILVFMPGYILTFLIPKGEEMALFSSRKNYLLKLRKIILSKKPGIKTL